MTARFVVATVFDGLASLAPASVDLVLTSPPFLALRSYLPNGHALKHREIGSEPTPADYLDTLLDVTEACDRVLAPHGSLVFELGDTYSGSGGAGGDYDPNGLRAGQPRFRQVESREHRPERAGTGADGGARVVPQNGGAGWPLTKSLALVPSLLAASLAYGRNLLRPQRTTPRWRVRNLVAWCRPNPPVGALGDKFRPATSYLTVACKSRTRYFDLDAVRQVNNPERLDERSMQSPRDFANFENGNRGRPTGAPQNPAGAPPLDWWEIPTAPYTGAHYATWPPSLLTRPILSMCPTKVCRTCGEPSRRVVGDAEYVPSATYRGGVHALHEHHAGDDMAARSNDASLVRQAPTLGWTDCGHNDWRRGVVLDPFAGTGSTLMVAIGHGRDAIGIDLDDRNAELVRERNGMFVTVEP